MPETPMSNLQYWQPAFLSRERHALNVYSQLSHRYLAMVSKARPHTKCTTRLAVASTARTARSSCVILHPNRANASTSNIPAPSSSCRLSCQLQDSHPSAAHLLSQWNSTTHPTYPAKYLHSYPKSDPTPQRNISSSHHGHQA